MICVNKTTVQLVRPGILAASALLALLLTSCSTTPDNENPLKYSPKLIKEGHTSLYNNGAFKVPLTEISLIPAAPSATGLALDMMGLHARQSFLTSLKNAADAIYLVPAGSKLSLDYAKKIHRGGKQAGAGITNVTRPMGTLIIDRSLSTGKDMTLHAWQFGKKTAASMSTYGVAIEQRSKKSGDYIATSLGKEGRQDIKQSWVLADKMSSRANKTAKKSLLYAGDEFIKGYVAVPAKLSQRGSDITEAADISNFSAGLSSANNTRSNYSKYMSELVVNTAEDYVDDVKGSLTKAGDSFNDSVTVTGFGLAFLKSTRWVLQGILWDGLVKPVAKIGAGSIGYLAVNLAAFPVMVVVKEGLAVTNLAIEVSWNTLGAGYDLVAPSAKAAVASIYSLFQFTAGNTAAGATAVGVAAFGTGTLVAGQVVGNTVKGVGYIVGKGVQYIGVPVTAAGVTLGAGTVGVVAGGAGVVAGSTVMLAGEAVSATANVFGTVLAGTTVVAGTAASVAVAGSKGVYEVSKAVVVPAGYELGGGIVLGYATTSQLAAHSILAVADASYLVLSLEGPRWVIYAVKGKLSTGDDLPPGTLLDLKAMQNKGEQLQYLPVSEQEMNAVVEQVYQELPTAPTTPVLVKDESKEVLQ